MAFEPYPAVRGIHSCGDFLDLLLAILRSRPPYLRSVELARYTALIEDLQQSCFTEYVPRERSVAVAAAPIDALKRSVHQWVTMHLQRRDNNPLMSSFAVDTARFVEAHAWGRRFYPPNGPWWRIVGSIDAAGEIERHRFDFLHNKQFKKEVTERGIGHAVAIFRLPDGIVCRDSRNEPVISGAKELGIVIRRGHLSESAVDNEGLSVDDNEPLEFDFTDEFWFHGRLIVVKDGRDLGIWTPGVNEYPRRIAQDDRYNIRIPGRWLVAAIRPARDGRGFERYDLPIWGP